MSKELLNKAKTLLAEYDVEELSFEEIKDLLKISDKECQELIKILDIEVEDIRLTRSELKKLVFELCRKEISLEEIALKLECDVLEVASVIKELKDEGYNILHFVKNDRNYVYNLGNDSLKKKGEYIIENDNLTEYKFLAISDTRLCSYYQQLNILNELYLLALQQGASFVLHCGDLSEGLYKNSQYKDTIFYHDTSSQSGYIVDNYPYIEGLPTYFITGEHDDTHIKHSEVNLGKEVSSQRDDLIYLGQNRCLIKVGKTNILMRHPRGKVAYTISYKSQRHIASMRSEDKVNVILNGHWCFMDDYVRRTINQFSVGCVVGQTPQMDNMDMSSTVGGYLITVKLDNKGNFVKTSYLRIPYYKTMDEDYRRVRVLRLNSQDKEWQCLTAKGAR